MLLNIVIGVVVVALLVARQLRPSQARETSSLRIIAILGVIGIVDVGNAMKHHHIGAGTVALIVLGLLIGVALGAARALTVRIWRDQAGVAWRQGTTLTAVLWVVSLAIHFGLDAVVDHVSGIHGLGTAGILLYLAVTLGAQREIVRWRARDVVHPAVG